MAELPSSSAHPRPPSKFSISMENQPPTSHTRPNNLEENPPNNFFNPFANTRPIDLSSPLFLHSGDNPGILLVPQPLSGENYSTWSRSMLVALSAKNKMCFIDGSFPKPSVFESYYNAWVRCNDLVVSWILNSVSKEIYSTVIYITSAEVMWQDLKDRYSQRNGPRVFQLQKAISAVTQENSSVSQYFTRIKALWEELNNYRPISICNCCNCGRMKSILELYSQEKVLQFLMGLNDSFSTVRAQILLTDPFPPINKVFSLIIQEEKQREITINSLSHDTSALMTRTPIPNSVASPMPNPVASPICHSHDHAAYMTKATSSGPRFSKQNFKKDCPICSHCGLSGHIVEKCYKVHGFPPGFKFTRSKPNFSAPHSSNQVQGTDLTKVQQLSNPPLAMISEQCQQLMELLKQYPIQSPQSFAANSVASIAESVPLENDWGG
ncbi:uncharacterized protein LOC132165206 [Corylus avellana]|uniref:uncharacterized protein LOC132165206 n=1 Tax=Corylus avellana TaxID=13451 RepID=UPI00286D532F|nr:uncharacterized protein LOC132165206 [Corylus avellana]